MQAATSHVQSGEAAIEAAITSLRGREENAKRSDLFLSNEKGDWKRNKKKTERAESPKLGAENAMHKAQSEGHELMRERKEAALGC